MVTDSGINGLATDIEEAQRARATRKGKLSESRNFFSLSHNSMAHMTHVDDPSPGTTFAL